MISILLLVVVLVACTSAPTKRDSMQKVPESQASDQASGEVTSQEVEQDIQEIESTDEELNEQELNEIDQDLSELEDFDV